MSRINQALFKQYDIRGIVGKNLSSKEAYLIGKGYGTYIQINGVKYISVGHDNRLSSEELTRALIDGLTETGCRVFDIGLTLTPIIDFSWYEINSPSSIMVTASHSPVYYNGFKLSLKRNLIFADKLQDIYRIIKKGRFKKGNGRCISKPINERYVNYIKRSIKLIRPLNVILDCGNGTASIIAPQLLHDLDCNLTLFHCISDGSFPHHDPYPQKVHEYKDHFIKAIKEKRADIGIALDGDGDRMGIFDEEGVFIENDKMIFLHAKDILKSRKKTHFVVNVAVSQAVIEGIENLGGRVVISKTGPPYMLSKMKETKALLGGEISGHLAFAHRYFGYDDGLYTACRTLELLSKSKEPLSEHFFDLPYYFSTPEFRVLAGERRKFAVIEALAEEFKADKDFDVLSVDGLRITTQEGWFLIRSSQTEPLVTGRVEAKSKKRLTELKTLVQNKLAKHSINLDWRNPIAKH